MTAVGGLNEPVAAWDTMAAAKVLCQAVQGYSWRGPPCVSNGDSCHRKVSSLLFCVVLDTLGGLCRLSEQPEKGLLVFDCEWVAGRMRLVGCCAAPGSTLNVWMGQDLSQDLAATTPQPGWCPLADNCMWQGVQGPGVWE